MTWTPLQQVPSALQLALCDAVRSTILQRDVGRDIRRGEDGMLIVPLDGGGTLRVLLQVRSETRARFGPREAIRVELDGRAVAGRVSYGLAAAATIDVKAKSFASVTCDIVWRDESAKASP